MRNDRLPRKVIAITSFFVLLLSTSLTVQAQSNTSGSIEGTVSDASGAVVPGATVTVTNKGTNVTLTETTRADGDYRAVNLAIGLYQVKVAKTGFGTQVSNDVDVELGHATQVNVQLAAGQASETVTVEASSVAITEDRGDRSTVLEAETLEKLPLEVAGERRQTDTFLTLAPGVTGDTFSARINGAPDFSQDFFYDGIPYMNADGGGRQENSGPPVDAVDEFAINTNAYSAQYGRSTGQLDFHLTSGTNRLHGAAWEYLRNNVFDAKGYFGSATTEKQHEFGFKLGGPIYIPKVYDGRNKAFFHVVFDWYRFRGGVATQLITLPTSRMLQGDFSQLPFPIFDPLTTRPGSNGTFIRDPFPGNIIPQSRESAISAAYISMIPAATNDVPFSNTVLKTPSAPTNAFYPFVKVDYSIKPRFIIHGSYYRTHSAGITSPTFSGPLGAGNSFGGTEHEPRFSLDQNYTANIINQTLYSIQKTFGTRTFFPLVPANSTLPLAVPGLPYPAITTDVPNQQQFGAGVDNNQTSGGCWYCQYFGDNFKWQKGNHGLSFGTEIREEDELDAFARNIGQYNFVHNATAGPDPGTGADTYGGFGFASFYLGAVNTASQSGGVANRTTKTGYRAFYAQDDIKLNPKLTVNLGLRWDYGVPAHAPNDAFSTFDPTVPNPGAGGRLGSLVFAGKQGGACIPQGGASLCRSQIADTYYGSWQPRFGFAYQAYKGTIVRGGFGKASLRGGASTLMGPEIAASFLTGIQYQNLLTSPDTGFTPPTQLQPTWDSGLPALALQPAPPRSLSAANGQYIPYMQRRDGKNGYTMNWSLTVEQQLPYRIAMETSYVGSSSVRIGGNLLNENQVPSQYLASLGPVLLADINSPAAAAAGIKLPYPGFTGSVAQALRPFPQFQYIEARTQTPGHSNYHSLQERLQKNYSNGMTFLVSYTWSKNIADSLDQFSTFSSTPLDTAQRRRERQVIGDNANGAAGGQNVAISTTYELPIGPGKALLNNSPVLGRVLGGWGVTGILQYSQRAPIAVSGGSTNPIYNNISRPNLVPGQPFKLYHGGKFHPATDRYLNPEAFSDAGQFALGDAPPTIASITPFLYLNENLGLVKETRIREGVNLELRAEAFNAFNRTVFGPPDQNYTQVNCNSPTAVKPACYANFGNVTSQTNAPRQLQFAARFKF
jgi:hypothetical protein